MPEPQLQQVIPTPSTPMSSSKGFPKLIIILLIGLLIIIVGLIFYVRVSQNKSAPNASLNQNKESFKGIVDSISASTITMHSGSQTKTFQLPPNNIPTTATNSAQTKTNQASGIYSSIKIGQQVTIEFNPRTNQVISISGDGLLISSDTNSIAFQNNTHIQTKTIDGSLMQKTQENITLKDQSGTTSNYLISKGTLVSKLIAGSSNLANAKYTTAKLTDLVIGQDLMVTFDPNTKFVYTMVIIK